MNLRRYLWLRGIKIVFFASQLGISRTSLYYYMRRNKTIPKYVKLAVKQLTDGKVTRIEDEIKKNNILLK